MQRLQDAGIHPYGSEQQQTHQKHLNRFFTREFARISETADQTVLTDQGPMWGETDSLMAHHYDEDERLFSHFLDTDYRAYSMAFYGDNADAISTVEITLEEAQKRKFALIAQRAGIQGNERILNIGCGFGSLELYLFQHFPNLNIMSITPSKVQAEYIRSIKDDMEYPFHGRQFTLIEDDFANLPAETLGAESFDRVISIGVVEHVNNLTRFFDKIYALLKPGGKSFHHLINAKITIPAFLDSNKTLIGKYFPGGKVWPYQILARDQNKLALEQCWFVNGMNYYSTLDAWHQRFWKNLPSLYPTVLDISGVKHWDDYFLLCKACFAPNDGEVYGNGHFLYRK